MRFPLLISLEGIANHILQGDAFLWPRGNHLLGLFPSFAAHLDQLNFILFQGIQVINHAMDSLRNSEDVWFLYRGKNSC